MSASKEIKVNVLHPNYQLKKLTQQFGVETVTFTATGGNYSVFELPAVAFNLSKSYLALSYTLPAAGGGVYSQNFEAVLAAIRRIQFYDHNSKMICDIDSFDRYTRIILNSDSTIEELNNGTPDTTLYKSNFPKGQPVYGIRPNEGNSNLSFNEQTYLSTSLNADYNAVANTAYTVRYKIPLSMFKNTIFALDKDLFFDDISFIRITWNPYTQLGFTNDGTANGAANNYAGPPTNTYVALYLAVETNEQINTSLKQTLYSSGITTFFDYVHAQNYALQGTSQTFTIRYGPGMGLRLKRIYWAQFETNPGNNTKYDINNLDGADLNYFRTYLNRVRLIDYDIDCRPGNNPGQGNVGYLDYMLMQGRLQGGAIQNRNIYQYNWFWCESFDGLKFHEHPDNVELGLDLTQKDIEYNVVMTTANNSFTYHVFGVAQRLLTIKKDNTTIV